MAQRLEQLPGKRKVVRSSNHIHSRLSGSSNRLAHERCRFDPPIPFTDGSESRAVAWQAKGDGLILQSHPPMAQWVEQWSPSERWWFNSPIFRSPYRMLTCN